MAPTRPANSSLPPPPPELLHLSVRCLKNSMSRFKSFFFRKIAIIYDFEQMSGLWSMSWFKSFRKFFRKIAIFCTFDHWSEILSLSAGRPISQGVCPPLQVMLSLLHAVLKWDLLSDRPAYMGSLSAVLYRLLYRHDLPKYSRPVKCSRLQIFPPFFWEKSKT